MIIQNILQNIKNGLYCHPFISSVLLMMETFSWCWDKVVSVQTADKNITKLLVSQDVNWWTWVMWITCELLWCFYQLFVLLIWRHPVTAEDPLVRKDELFLWRKTSLNYKITIIYMYCITGMTQETKSSRKNTHIHDPKAFLTCLQCHCWWSHWFSCALELNACNHWT